MIFWPIFKSSKKSSYSLVLVILAKRNLATSFKISNKRRNFAKSGNADLRVRLQRLLWLDRQVSVWPDLANFLKIWRFFKKNLLPQFLGSQRVISRQKIVIHAYYQHTMPLIIICSNKNNFKNCPIWRKILKNYWKAKYYLKWRILPILKSSQKVPWLLFSKNKNLRPA